ncbi:MAG: EamA family transporter [Candidatus Krumholzibacteriia bacterium]
MAPRSGRRGALPTGGPTQQRRCALLHLIAASLIWAFSFGLIKTQLAGIDPALLAFLRLALAAAVLAPWLSRRVTAGVRGALLGLGAVQFGLMYMFYLAAYAHLPAYGVAVATIFTPLYVAFLEDALRRRLVGRHVLAAALAVAGAAVVQFRGDVPGATGGFLLVQASNLAFAVGQVLYRRVAPAASRPHRDARDGPGRPAAAPPADDAAAMAWMYVGAALLAGTAALLFGDRSRWTVPADAWLVIAYLGLLPTAVGFYLWNRGAARTSAGILAVSNNLKVPLAVGVAWLVFGESADHVRVLGGLSLLVAALFVAGRER